jgi:hypothetical protein
MADFARENEKSEIVQEAIGDTLDDAMEEDGAAEEEDMIVSQVDFSRVFTFSIQFRCWMNWELAESIVFLTLLCEARKRPLNLKKNENVSLALFLPPQLS